ncbi:MAG: hypothetical protein KDC33_00485 [Thermoleophilia bacterium]|nr:hypothetical protein [Thermoleophilia bacterium]
MELGTILGLPAHPLLVHVPVVMIPLTLVLALAAAVWAPWRRALALGALVTATAGMLGAQFAVMSGEPLEERVDHSSVLSQHAELGEQTRTIAILAFLAAAAYAAREWRGRAPGILGRAGNALRGRGAGIAVLVVLLASTAVCTVWAARTGHMGAKAAWGDLPAQGQGDSGQGSAHTGGRG